jgi:SPP1 gp7 family putative phage head morphogenesis protein
MPYQKDAKAILDLFLQRLFLQEKKEFLLLATKYETIQDELERLILRLAEKEIKSEDQLYRLELYKQFQKESKEQIERYSKIAGKTIENGQKLFGKAGIESAEQMLGLQVKFFRKLPVDVINNFVGKSFYNGAKLDDTLFASSYPKFMDKVKDELLKGIAMGRNPREVARLIRKESKAPLWESLRLARTEQLMIFRETSVMSYEKSGVCSGFERIERSDACDDCQSLNGKKYKFDEAYDDFHPNCRGAFIPLVG